MRVFIPVGETENIGGVLFPKDTPENQALRRNIYIQYNPLIVNIVSFVANLDTYLKEYPEFVGIELRHEEKQSQIWINNINFDKKSFLCAVIIGYLERVNFQPASTLESSLESPLSLANSIGTPTSVASAPARSLVLSPSAAQRASDTARLNGNGSRFNFGLSDSDTAMDTSGSGPAP